MKRTRIYADTVTEPAEGMWSNALRVDDQLFISGLTARASDGVTIDGADAYEQAQVIFAKIQALVEAAGGAIDDVVKMTIYVTDMATNALVWKARKEFFHGDFPACALVQVAALAKAEILVEIEAIAIIGSSAE